MFNIIDLFISRDSILNSEAYATKQNKTKQIKTHYNYVHEKNDQITINAPPFMIELINAEEIIMRIIKFACVSMIVETNHKAFSEWIDLMTKLGHHFKCVLMKKRNIQIHVRYQRLGYWPLHQNSRFPHWEFPINFT